MTYSVNPPPEWEPVNTNDLQIVDDYSNVNPLTTNTSNLGSTIMRWKMGGFRRLNIANTNIADNTIRLLNLSFTGNVGFGSPTGIYLLCSATASLMPHTSYGLYIDHTNQSSGFFGNAGQGIAGRFFGKNNRNSGASTPVKAFGVYASGQCADTNWATGTSEAYGAKLEVDQKSDATTSYGVYGLVPSTVDTVDAYGGYFESLSATATNNFGLWANGATADLVLENQKIKVSSTGQVYTLPATDGSSGQVLSTNGSGTLSWIDDADTNYWNRTGTTLTPINVGDDIDMNGQNIYNIDVLQGTTTDNITVTSQNNKQIRLNSSATVMAQLGDLAGTYDFHVENSGDGTVFRVLSDAQTIINGGSLLGTEDCRIIGDTAITGGSEFRIYDTGDSNYVGFDAPALTANQIWTLPDSDGNAGEVLETDGGGNLSWGQARKDILDAGNNVAMSVSGYLKFNNGTLFRDTLGYRMMNNGSVIGCSIQTDVTAVTTPGNVEIQVRNNGTSVFVATLSITATGIQGADATQAAGIDTFNTGDVLTLYVNFTTFVGTINDPCALMELLLN
jgi:hypothetical protein